ASIPPIRIALDYEARRAGIRLNKLDQRHPLIQRLPEEWRDPTGYVAPPPLPKHPHSRNKKVLEKTTKLHDLAKWTSVREERILPYATPPWRRDVPDFGGRLVIAAKSSDDKREKKAAAKTHKIEARKLLASEESLLVYTDGSMRPLHRVRRVGAGAQIGLGSHAEVYDAEMVGLRWGLQAALHFVETHPN
ncbi:hypothetical protein EV121DRAFT_172348, partial [Schizophyllum commune]